MTLIEFLDVVIDEHAIIISDRYLLDFDVSVNDTAAFLLRRGEHAHFAVEYMKYLARKSTLTMGTKVPHLLRGMFEFTHGHWMHLVRQNAPNCDLSDQELLEALVEYLKIEKIPGWGSGIVDANMVEHWLELAEPIATMVKKRTASSIHSPKENPILALPHVPVAADLTNAASVDEALSQLRDFLVATSRKAEITSTVIRRQRQLGIAPIENHAAQLAMVYAAYGKNWDALAKCTVPLKAPFLVKTTEKRGMYLSQLGEVTDSHQQAHFWSWRKSSSQLVVFGDAQSNHVNVRVADTNVELLHTELRVLNELHNPIRETPEFEESTPELLSFYDSEERRPYRIWLDLPLKPSGSANVSRWVILVLTATALLGRRRNPYSFNHRRLAYSRPRIIHAKRRDQPRAFLHHCLHPGNPLALCIDHVWM